MKRLWCILPLLLLPLAAFPSDGARYASLTKFIKGNIRDKTRAVTEASGDEAYVLSREAMSFALAYGKILGEDKELSALVTAGVLSLKAEDVRRMDSVSRSSLVSDFCDVFALFKNDETVCTALIGKVSSMKGDLPLDMFAAVLNKSLENNSNPSAPVINALGEIGDEKSFAVLYALETDRDNADEINKALAAILDREKGAVRIALEIVRGGGGERLLLITEDAQDNIKGDIAEAVLGDSLNKEKGGQADYSPFTEMAALGTLKDLRWTRAASVVSSLLSLKKGKWAAGEANEDEVCKTIEAAAVISPIESGVIISDILIAEVAGKKNEAVIDACIKALRAIGDKSAFDALLAVTNADVDIRLKTLANAALSALKW